ncbi:MAG TPA: UDP-N-acetylmuramoyl-L-alanine--D-glutamate ligase [Candidatus Limnocylindrales bacterium]|nr:UDP-N-acetylmuramoyl-L-alanine--D-glutamate ligase [Candidatus Limnocylindrales bacterium]
MSRQPAAAVGPIALDRLSLDSFAGQPVAVLGLARSGLALSRFLSDRGARVTAYDARPASDLEAAVAALAGRPVRLLLGPQVDPAEAFHGQALITTSPAVSSRFPTTEPRLRAALAAVEAAGRVPVLSEIDLFLRLCPAVTVGVTGTKGKTTTAALSAAILGAGPARVELGGNIGRPLVELLPELGPQDRVVLELSELQLPTLSRGTNVAVYTHVTQDHLDRHGSVAAYRAVKRRLAELVDPEGALVLNAEDPVSLAYAGLGLAPVVLYRRDEPLGGGLGVVDDWIVAAGVGRLPGAGGGVAATGPRGRILPLDEVPLPGQHSWSNVLAAVAVGLLFGIAPDAIRRAVAAFPGVAHRLEPVAVIDGVRFVNDSMGTQPDAVVAAMQAFSPPLVLIAGGRDKGVPLDELAGVAVERAGAVVLYGESAPLLASALATAGHRHVERVADLTAAVERADAIARDGAFGQGPGTAAGADAGRGLADEGLTTVLLSPAAASFDQYVDYAARGEAFRAAVAGLAQRRRRR